MEETRMQSSPTSIGRQLYKVLVIANLQKEFLKRIAESGSPWPAPGLYSAFYILHSAFA
jgi:hypothetical protein